jgi:hypothetical protein
MQSLTGLATTIRALLTTRARRLARIHGGVQRRSRFAGDTLVQTLVLGWLSNPCASLRQLCQMARIREVVITPQGLAQRFTPGLAATLQAVLAEAAQTVVAAREPVAIPLLARFTGVYLVDTTTISLPAALARDWPGCGGTTDQGEAAVKVATSYDLRHGSLAGLSLAAGRTHDRMTAVSTMLYPVDSLVLRDLGFFRLDDLAAFSAAGVGFLTRLHASTVVWTDDETRRPVTTLLADTLTAQQSDRSASGLRHVVEVDLPVQLGASARVAVRLLAERVPRAVRRQRQARLRREARKKRQTVRPERLALAGWTVLVTNLPVERLTLAEALALLRARWQIELLFKLWKQDGQLATWRSTQPWRILCEVYAKLIGLIIQHWLTLTAGWEAPDHSLVAAGQVVRAHAVTIAHALDRPRRLREALAAIQACLPAAGRLNPRRKQPNTAQRLRDPDGTRAACTSLP